MTDLLLATVVSVVLVAVGMALLAAVTLVPFVVSLQLAESREFSSSRWGALSLAGSAIGLLVLLVFLRSDRPLAVALVALIPVLAPAALLRLLSRGDRLGGRAGSHE